MSQPLSANALWITWEIQPRNKSMSKLIGADLKELIVNKSRWIKYPILIVRTAFLLINNRSKVIFVQNPSIVLAYVSSVLKYFLGYKLIVDAHNAGIYPLEGKSQILNYITRKICLSADMVIVTNAALYDQVRVWGGQPFIMPDPLPDYGNIETVYSEQQIKNFLLICTWADDEPYLEIIDAAKSLQGIANLRITGNYRKRLTSSQVESLPKNITLLGFVSEEDYIYELSCADFTIDLTTRDNCLVCGAYESIAMGIPGIISDTSVNRQTFSLGFVYSKNDSNSIRESILQAVAKITFYRSGVSEMKNLHISRIIQYKDKLLADLFSGAGSL
jgi:glycosyltransferase involved in cell wall biosynthesis